MFESLQASLAFVFFVPSWFFFFCHWVLENFATFAPPFRGVVAQLVRASDS